MNKFLRRDAAFARRRRGDDPGRSPKDNRPEGSCPYRREETLLQDAAACWNSLDGVRQKAERSFRYAWGNQWGDRVPDPCGRGTVTEEQLIRSQGNQPLKNNMIAPIMNNIEGQFKGAVPKTVVSSRNQANAKAGDMMSVAIEYVQDNNATDVLDADTFISSLCSGIKMQRVEYGWNEDKYTSDVWIYNVEYDRCFFNTDSRDPRAWDIRIIGELFDATLADIKARFANAQEPAQRARMMQYIDDIYGYEDSGLESQDPRSMEDDDTRRNVDFYRPARTDRHRVILVWRKEYREALFVHDTLRGTTDFVDDSPYWRRTFDTENRNRQAMAEKAGIGADNAMPVLYEPKTEIYWQYYYLSPAGDILETGRSPFWHHSHNYAIGLYPLRNGRLYNYVEQFIDQQRSINRTLMQIDFIRGSSARGLLVVDETAFQGMSKQDIIDEYTRYNGVFFVRPRNGTTVQQVVQQWNTSAVAAGDFELLQLQLKLINDIAGVGSAMQGHEAKAGVSATMYNMQAQNSAVNMQGIFSSFRAFRRERDYKLMMTIQQYYNERKYIDIAGNDYQEEAKWYDPEKVKNAKLYLRIADGGNTPAYQDLQNEFLMKLYEQQGIDVMTMLETSSYPWAPRLIETIKRRQQEAAEARQAVQPLPDEDMQAVRQAAPDPRIAGLMADDSLAAETDGIPKKA